MYASQNVLHRILPICFIHKIRPTTFFLKLRENQKIYNILNGIMNYSHTIKRQSLKCVSD